MKKFKFEKKINEEVEAHDEQEAIEKMCEKINDIIYEDIELVKEDNWGEDTYENLGLSTSDFV